MKWDAVDYLVVDRPPGTGDIALSLSQSIPVAGGAITTLQTVSLADTRRGEDGEKLNIPAMGMIENMATSSARRAAPGDIFGKEAARRSREASVPFLGAIPIHEPIRIGGTPACRSASATQIPRQAFRAVGPPARGPARHLSSKQVKNALLTQVR